MRADASCYCGFKKLPQLIVLVLASLLTYGCTQSVQHGGYITGQGRALPSGLTTVVGNAPSPPPTVSHRSVVHEVAPLETIWRLSKMYDVSQESIYLANNLKPGSTIQIGQKLVIPNAKPLRHVVSLYPNNQWKYIIIHHTATDVGKALMINNYHHDRGFWNGLGYHFVIGNGTMGKLDGQIEVSPRWIKQQTGAHCKAGNMNSMGIGIALVGNFNVELPTAAQMDSLAYLLRLLSDYYKIPSSRIIGHRDVEGAKTDCPGKRFPWPTIRQCLAQR